LCCKSNKQGRRPAWVYRELILELGRKRNYMASGSEVRLRRKITELWLTCRERTRKDKGQLERKLTSIGSDNKKFFSE